MILKRDWNSCPSFNHSTALPASGEIDSDGELHKFNRWLFCSRPAHVTPELLRASVDKDSTLVLSLCALKLLEVVLQLTNAPHAWLTLFALHDDRDAIALL